MADTHPHKKHIFRCHVEPLPIQNDDDVKELLIPPPVHAAIKFRYKFKRYQALMLGDQDHTGKTAILDRHEENKESTCQLLLSELECFNNAFTLLSPELSRLGVRRRWIKGIVKRLVNYAHKVGTQIVQDSNSERKVGVLVPIVVELLRFRSKWMCDDHECLRQGERKSAMKMLLKSFRVKDSDNQSHCCCAICLEEFGVGTTAVRVPCLHEFHPKCIQTWLLKNSSCPVCRFLMPLP